MEGMIAGNGGFQGNTAGRGLLGKLVGGGAVAKATSAPETAEEKAAALPLTSPTGGVGSNAGGMKILGILKSKSASSGEDKSAVDVRPSALDKKGIARSSSAGTTVATMPDKKGIARSTSAGTVTVTPGILGGTDLMVLGTVPPSNKKKSPRAVTMPMKQQPRIPPFEVHSFDRSSNGIGSPSESVLSSSSSSIHPGGSKITYSIETLLEIKRSCNSNDHQAPPGLLERFDFEAGDTEGYSGRGGSFSNYRQSPPIERPGDYYRGQTQTPPLTRPGYDHFHDRNTPPRDRGMGALKQTGFMTRNTPPRQRSSPAKERNASSEQTWTRGLSVDQDQQQQGAKYVIFFHSC
jgi:hypothetical protein